MKNAIVVCLILFLASACSNSPENKTASTGNAPAAATPAAKAPDEAAALRAMGDVNKAQADYFKRNRRYALTYEELVESHNLPAEPSSDNTGYTFRLRPAPDAASYSMTAVPITPSPTTRYFFTDQSGTIRAEPGKEATSASPAI